MAKQRRIKVDVLARVEGEGALDIRVAGGAVQDVQFKIFEPPRYFEAFLRGRGFFEAPDITARICGICPVAYQMSSVHAMEQALGAAVGGSLRELRRLIYCGEWIESHVLHMFMLHAPDFLGYHDAIAMAKDHPETVKNALQLKKAGNDIVALLGGREIHPINVRVGGFYKTPAKGAPAAALEEKLLWARGAAVDAVRFAAGLDFPDLEQDYEFVSLRHPDEYPFCEGRLVSNKGLDIDIADFGARFAEEHVERSNALHCVLKERGSYFVGPLARFNLNFDKLSPLAKRTAEEVGFTPPCNNPYKSIIARAVETVFAVEEALRIISAYEPPPEPAVKITPRAGVGHGCTEAPRGSLYHRYRLDGGGSVLDAWIVPPTSQNQKTIEEDLRRFVADRLDLSDDALTRGCEQVIRNYDPCISCATHRLNVRVVRE